MTAHLIARRLATLVTASTLAVAASALAGTGAAAWADPGNGHGNGAAANTAVTGAGNAADNGHGKDSAPGQQKKNDDTATTGAASSSAAGNGSAGSHASTGTAGTSGDPTQPQPLSNADKKKGGANNGGDCGAYCSTRDGSASKNGNGNGKATGKPCAGCVGKADNKNPKGQRPNGSDHNNGYECDGNHGIGKGNPAHTGCQPTKTTGCVASASNNYCGNPPGCVPSAANHNCGNPPGCVPSAANHNCGNPPGCVPSTANHNCGNPGTDCATQAAAAGASVTVNGDGTCTSVLGTKVTRPRVQVLGERVTALPFTGATVELFLLLAGAALTAGAVLTTVGRRRRDNAADV